MCARRLTGPPLAPVRIGGRHLHGLPAVPMAGKGHVRIKRREVAGHLYKMALGMLEH